MSEQGKPLAESVLTEEERALTLAFQVHYGAEVKLAMAELGNVLGIGDEAKHEWIGGIAAQLDEQDLNFEQRREVAMSVRWLAACLSGAETETGVAFEPLSVRGELQRNGARALPSGLEILSADAPSAPTSSTPIPPVSVSSPASAGMAPQPSAGGTFKPEAAAREPLSNPQKSFLEKMGLPEEAITQLDDLTVRQRISFAINLGDAYQKLRIKRMGPEAKKVRAQQMAELMGGMSYVEIAEKHDTASSNMHVGLSTLTKVVRERIASGELPLDEILAMIPEPGQPQPDEGNSAPETDDMPQPLSTVQSNWYHKLFGNVERTDEAREHLVAHFKILRPSQQDYLATRLERLLRSNIIRREGKVKTDRRVDQMRQLITGSSVEEIAAATGLSEDHVKKDLHNSATSLQRHTPNIMLLEIVDETVKFIPQDQLHE